MSTTRLRESVRTKRFQLQLQRENLKLAAVLKGEVIDGFWHGDFASYSFSWLLYFIPVHLIFMVLSY